MKTGRGPRFLTGSCLYLLPPRLPKSSPTLTFAICLFQFIFLLIPSLVSVLFARVNPEDDQLIALSFKVP